jgi:serine/threonine-protein kinase
MRGVAGAPDDPRVGTSLQGRYKILERLSAGAMGVVYRAERVQLGRIVAVKFLHSMFSQNADSIRRFELEAKTMSRLEHPHCVSVIDFGVADSPFIVMEFVTGTTLRALIDQGPVAPSRALPLVRQMLAGLAHAHEKGIIHRDVKPANVMLAQMTGTGDHVRLLDFGLAKLRDADASHSSLVVGTPSYMSPEQASGKKVDGRCDVYATGVVLFELLTGEKPFFSDQAFEMIRMHLEAKPPRLADKLPGATFSPELEAVVARALEKSPADRFQTPTEFIQALEEVPEWPGAPRAQTSGGNGGRAETQPLPRAAEPPAAVPAPVDAASATGSTIMAQSISIDRPPRSRGGGLGWIVVLLLLGGAAAAWWALGRPGWPKETASSSSPAPSPGKAGKPTGSVADDTDAKIRALHEQRRKNPDDARVSYSLANLYFSKGRSSHVEALAAYREAIEKDASFKKNTTLLRNVISMLAHENTREKARAVILKHIGQAATAELRRASTSGADAELKKQAARLLDEVSRLR